MFTLDKMEIQGFKSFYGRTQFEFRPGIIAVVGPNGCGKSNIGDAISWVLGDQSPRSLRADRMQDVLFSGSDARKATGMAEVTLRFVSSNGNGEAAESFVVSRRLYRSGESEYLLNGNRCRLRDIQETLVRSQVGSRLYSVIEQGKVDLVLATKPKDRRALFEEAAGILGYKTKRRVAEGKLEATQANLLRIHDILTEVERQANSLRRQVAKARRYQRLQERIRDRRAILLRTRLDEIAGEEASAKRHREELAVHEAELSARLGAATSAVEARRRSFEETETQARQGRERLNEIDRALDRDRALLERSREQSEQARQDVERWTREAAEIRGRLAEREARLEERARLLEESRAAARSLEEELGDRERAQRVLSETAEQSEQEKERCRSALLTTLDRLAEARSRAQLLEEELRRNATRRAAIAGETAAARREADRCRVEMEELQVALETREAERSRIDREREAAAGDLAEVDRAIERIASEREDLAGRLARAEERIRALEDSEGRAEGDRAGAEAILGEAREGRLRARGRVADLLEVDPEWLPAAEAALQEVLSAVMVEGSQEAVAGIRFLRETTRGRCAFLSGTGNGSAAPDLPADLQTDPRCGGRLLARMRVSDSASAALRPALGRVLVAADLPAALELHAIHSGWSFVTREGDVVLASGLIQGGSEEPGRPGPLSRRHARGEEERNRAEILRLRDAAETEREERESARRAIAERLAGSDQRLREADRALVEGRLRLAQREEEAARGARLLRVAEEEEARLASEAAQVTAERRGLEEVLAAEGERRRELEESIAAAAGRVVSDREASTAGAESLGEFRSRVAVERQKLASREEDVATWSVAVREERERLNRAEHEAAAATGRITSLAAAIAEVGGSLERGQTERGGRASDLERLESSLAGIRTELLAAEQAEKEARSVLEELRGRIAEADVAAARIGVELEHLESGCREELGIGLAELRERPLPGEPAGREDLEREIGELRARLERLGAVNLAALEQYREMEERHQFLAKQRRDLEEAIESLRETIRRINRTSREKFLEAFGRIQEEFDRCFTSLFGGGRAELRLLEEEDVLEAGIEITASPPGKRLQSISLLSGGEKAMTAVALLFALFRYRPSPFCVLDEVDAPLDEANVSRFTRMLREMTHETQFILITHNRRSMEAADLLYGVTMEEPGISKVVSMRLDA
jgi:chromosome segregation protein